MIRVTFVCHGNICRSPMAEFLMKDKLEKLGIANEFFVSSHAVSDEEIWNGVGNPVYPPVKRLLSGLGISCEQKRATLLTAADGEKYDWFLCMDESNVRRAKRILGEKHAEKCVKLLSFVGGGDVADPWYSRDFEAAYRDISRGIDGFLGNLGY